MGAASSVPAELDRDTARELAKDQWCDDFDRAFDAAVGPRIPRAQAMYLWRSKHPTLEAALATARSLFEAREMWSVDLGQLADGSLDVTAAERAYADAFVAGGGPKAVELNAASARRWATVVAAHAATSSFGTLQAPNFRGYPLALMLDELGQGSIRAFGERELALLERELRVAGTAARIVVPPAKSHERAAIKCRMKYMNDCSHLVDVNRCSVVVADYAALYAVLEHVARKWGPGPGVARPRLIALEDRVAKCMGGGYRDVQMLVDLSGAIWELQLTTEGMLEAKEGQGGHVVYETMRFVEEMVLFCAIDGDLATLREMLQLVGDKCDVVAVDAKKDLNGMRALHHAAARGGASMVDLLLGLGADPFRADWAGATALYWAARMHRFDIARTLAAAMTEAVEPGGSTERHKAAIVRILELTLDIVDVVPDDLRKKLDYLHERCDRPRVADGCVVNCAKCGKLVALWNQRIDGSWIIRGQPALYFSTMHGVRVAVGKWGDLRWNMRDYPNAVRWSPVTCNGCDQKLGQVQSEVNWELAPANFDDSKTGCFLVAKERVTKDVELAPAVGPPDEELRCPDCNTYVGSLGNSVKGSWVCGGEPAFMFKSLTNIDLKSGFWGDLLKEDVTYKKSRLWKPVHCIKCDRELGIQTCKNNDTVPEKYRLSEIGWILGKKVDFKCGCG